MAGRSGHEPDRGGRELPGRRLHAVRGAADRDRRRRGVAAPGARVRHAARGQSGRPPRPAPQPARGRPPPPRHGRRDGRGPLDPGGGAPAPDRGAAEGLRRGEAPARGPRRERSAGARRVPVGQRPAGRPLFGAPARAGTERRRRRERRRHAPPGAAGEPRFADGLGGDDQPARLRPRRTEERRGRPRDVPLEHRALPALGQRVRQPRRDVPRAGGQGRAREYYAKALEVQPDYGNAKAARAILDAKD